MGTYHISEPPGSPGPPPPQQQQHPQQHPQHPQQQHPQQPQHLPAPAAAAALFTALGDPTRRQVFERVAARPQSVGELARDLPVSRPAVSQHLRVLREAGLVTDRAAGTRRIYEMDPRGLADLRAYLDHFWNQALAAFRATVERQQEEER